MGEDEARQEGQGAPPPLPLQIIARGMSIVISRAPFLWPVLRGPTRRFWERAAGGWDERIRPDSEEHLAALAAGCDRLGDPPRQILELGTGTGSGALMLARRFPGAEVRGVDISGAMVSQAQQKAPAELEARLRFEVADVASLPYEAGTFDLVCQLNLPLYADEVARVLAPGGHVVIASSRGASTPYYTPDRVLRRRFERLGLEALPGGREGEGTYFLARRP